MALHVEERKPLSRWPTRLAQGGAGLFYALSALVILAAFAVDGHPRLEIGYSLLEAFRHPFQNLLPASDQFLYGSPLVLWLGFVFEVESVRGLWLLSAGMLAVSLLCVLRSIATSSLTALQRYRFFLAFFAGSTLSVFLEWLGKSDCLLLLGYALVFFRAERRAWLVLGAVVMTLAHVEQALLLLGMHLVLRWPDAEARRPAQLACATWLGTALAYELAKRATGLTLDATRDVWLANTALEFLGRLVSAQSEAFLTLLVALLSLCGAGWLFVGHWFVEAHTAERLRLLSVIAVAFLVTCATHVTVRVATVLGWPLLAHAAERWARSDAPLVPWLSPSLARFATLAFCVVWWLKGA